MITIAIDAMGGDFGPEPIVEGLLLALEEVRFKAILVGDEDKIKPLISNDYSEIISILHADEVFGMHESASSALKRKETSIYKAVELVNNNEAQAVVSAGHSGATMGLSTIKIGRLKGVSRPAIATLMPTCTKGSTLLLDVGANVDCKPENLFEFAVMGEAYAKDVLKKEKPRVGLLSNGEEESKGNELSKGAFSLLKKLDCFVGNVEGNNIFDGSIDVVVCDGFTGNVVLKEAEAIYTLLRKRGIQDEYFDRFNYENYGGTPILGVQGNVIIGHGISNGKAIKNMILHCYEVAKSGLATKIKEAFNEYE